MSPRTIPWPVYPCAQACGAWIRSMFHSTVSGAWGAAAVLGGRIVDLIHGSGMIRATSALAARASTTARVPDTRSRLTNQCERYRAPMRLSSAVIGAWVWATNDRRVWKTNRPFATFVGSAWAPLRSACLARTTRNVAVPPWAVCLKTLLATLAEGAPGEGTAGEAAANQSMVARPRNTAIRTRLCDISLPPVSWQAAGP